MVLLSGLRAAGLEFNVAVLAGTLVLELGSDEERVCVMSSGLPDECPNI